MSVTDSGGTQHLLFSRNRGHDGVVKLSMQIDADGTTSFAEGRGTHLFASSDDRIISYDRKTGTIWGKNKNHQWLKLTSVPFAENVLKSGGYQTPNMDANNRLWFCSCHGKHLICDVLELDSHHADQGVDKAVEKRADQKSDTTTEQRWRSLRVDLDHRLPPNCDTVCNLNRDGRLEILVCRYGHDGLISIVETAQVVKFDDGASDE